MTHFNYSLNNDLYSWRNALLWGNFVGHCKQTRVGTYKNRTVHALIAIIELLPIISQGASICEKIIIEKFSSKDPSLGFSPLSDRNISVKNFSSNKAKQLSENYKKKMIDSLPQNIKNQRSCKTYKRSELIPLQKEDCNYPIALSSVSNKIKHFSEGATFYGYNAEGIDDYGWGCAWRAIQTCLSAYEINLTLEELFHLFGPYKNIQEIYKDKYPLEELSNLKLFAPYDLSSGWADPFIAHMVMHFFSIPSTLETVNGIPARCTAPKQVFHYEPLCFNSFKTRLENHFKTTYAAPVMIDDGSYALNIIGIDVQGVNTILWIADPHIKAGVNKSNKSPSGLYTITLNQAGLATYSSLVDEDNYQIPSMFNERSYRGLHFQKKPWMVLFPKIVTL